MENQKKISKMGSGVAIYESLVSGITIYKVWCQSLEKEWKSIYLEDIRMYMKGLKGFGGFRADYVSWGSEIRGTESEHKVGRSSDV